KRVVAATVERARIQPTKVPDPRDRYSHQPVEKLVRPLTSQGDGEAHGHARAYLELGDRLTRPANAGPLAGDRGELLRGGLEQARVLLRLAEAHIDGHLLHPRRLDRRGVAEPLHHLGADLLEISLFESCPHAF